MSEMLERTQAMLARHHRHGENFAQLMKDTFAGRFNEEFWTAWRQWIEPVLSASPVVLDLGSGPGLLLRALAERYPRARAIGVECAPYMLEAMGELPTGCEVMCADLHDPRLPLAEGTVDAVVASVVLHELNQPLRALQEVRRCLKPGGRLYILDWVRAPLDAYVRNETSEERIFDPVTPVSELEDIFTHFIEHNRFSREDLGYLLERCCFAVLDSTSLREGRFARLVAEKK
ncbi:MAG: class I SAM-dependent methyltransferase [Gammaproteobacteria bacterium]|nr:class I SAM-dependent methyltransferase [Gammaproteobacteria bacterium]